MKFGQVRHQRTWLQLFALPDPGGPYLSDQLGIVYLAFLVAFDFPGCDLLDKVKSVCFRHPVSEFESLFWVPDHRIVA